MLRAEVLSLRRYMDSLDIKALLNNEVLREGYLNIGILLVSVIKNSL